MLFPLTAATCFCIWWGGLIFYSAVVVPLGSEIFSPIEQAQVTESVTIRLNVLGTVNVIFLGLMVQLPWLLGRRNREAFAPLLPLTRIQSQNFKFYTVITMGVTQILLWVIHYQLNHMFDASNLKIYDSDWFYQLHRFYLWLTMLQMWLGFLCLAMVARMFPDDEGQQV